MSLFEEYDESVKEVKNAKTKIMAKIAKAVNANASDGVVAFATYQEDTAIENLEDCATFKDFKKQDFVVTAVTTQLDDYSKMQVILRDDRACANHRTLPLFRLDGVVFSKVGRFIAVALGENI